jgi:hypothetical protein
VDGDTGGAVRRLVDVLTPIEAEILDLAPLDLRPFDYAKPGQPDDFESVVERLLAHDRIVLATPVYWYAMSGRMKTVFDRLSDLLSDRDPDRRGRALAGRQLWALAVGTEPALPPGFEIPFIRTAGYLGMTWRSSCYIHTGIHTADPQTDFIRFAEEIAA